MTIMNWLKDPGKAKRYIIYILFSKDYIYVYYIHTIIARIICTSTLIIADEDLLVEKFI